jgi:hypothetical protein
MHDNNGNVIVCKCFINDGHIVKNFFAFVSLRERAKIVFCEKGIIASNHTSDNEIYGVGILRGDEINITWDKSIPEEQRDITLEVFSSTIIERTSKLRKQIPVRIYLIQNTDSFGEYTIAFSFGTGGEQREGCYGSPAILTAKQDVVLRLPGKNASKLAIPVKDFRQMLEEFIRNKTKREKVKLAFYENLHGNHGILLTTDIDDSGQTGSLNEKYGYIPLQNIPYFASEEIVTSDGSTPITMERIPGMHEYSFSIDKITIFSKMAALHNEGLITVIYSSKCHLQIKYRFGAFGTASIYLVNPYVSSK